QTLDEGQHSRPWQVGCRRNEETNGGECPPQIHLPLPTILGKLSYLQAEFVIRKHKHALASTTVFTCRRPSGARRFPAGWRLRRNRLPPLATRIMAWESTPAHGTGHGRLPQLLIA